jgi:hypothetical protein
MASIALAWVEAGAGAVLAGIAAVEAGVASIAFEAALAAEAAAPAACEAALAAADVALAAFCAACCAWSAADWPSPELLQADNDRAIAVATAATSTVRVNFIGDLLDWAVESHGGGLRIKQRLAE